MNSIGLHRYYGNCANFGDDIGDYIFYRFFAEMQSDYKNLNVSLIGSILGLPYSKGGDLAVFGSGFGYAGDLAYDRCKVVPYFVRGPLTDSYLSGKSEAYADAAYFLLEDEVIQKFRGTQVGGRVGFIPHYTSIGSSFCNSLVQDNNLFMIDPSRHFLSVIKDIASCEKIYCEAMHGAIFADMLRVPWQPLSTSRHFNIFKWIDYCMGAGVDFRPLFISNGKDDFFVADQRKVLSEINLGPDHLLDVYRFKESKAMSSIKKRLSKFSSANKVNDSIDVDNDNFTLSSEQYLREASRLCSGSVAKFVNDYNISMI